MSPPSLLLRAAWICPIAQPPIRDGWVHVEDGVVTAVGHGRDAPAAAAVTDLGSAAVLPGLVNAHTHLELSWLEGRVPPCRDFVSWVGQLMAARPLLEQPEDPAVMEPVARAIAAMRASGTAAVGDTANALITPPLLEALDMPAVVFHELLGFGDADGGQAVHASRARCAALQSPRVRVVTAPHAPFSVSPELFRAIRDAVRSAAQPLTSVHVAESDAEVRLLHDGTGPWRERLQALGVWREGWTPPGVGPGDYLCDLGVIEAGTLVVHGVQLTDAELSRIAARGGTIVTCPRSNAWVGAGVPPVARFLASGVPLAVGTDSLASTPDLNLFAELAELRRLAPEVAPGWLLDAATRGGARALQLDRTLGTIEPGKHARLIAVTLPDGTTDPEAALVAGVEPARVGWPAARGPAQGAA